MYDTNAQSNRNEIWVSLWAKDGGACDGWNCDCHVRVVTVYLIIVLLGVRGLNDFYFELDKLVNINVCVNVCCDF